MERKKTESGLVRIRMEDQRSYEQYIFTGRGSRILSYGVWGFG